MPKALNTYQKAYDACDPLFFEEGRFPTIERVRERIQVNSPAVIKRAMNDWTLHFVEKHRKRLERPELPPALIEAAETLWQDAQALSEQTFEQQRKALTEKEQGWVREREELRNQLEAAKNGWAEERAKGEGAEKQWTAEKEVLEHQIRVLTEQVKGTETELQRMRESNAALSAEVGTLKETLAGQRKEAETLAEQQQDWFVLRIDEERVALERRHQEALQGQAERFQDIERDWKRRTDYLNRKVENSEEQRQAAELERAGLQAQVEEQTKWMTRLDGQLESERRAAAETIAALEQRCEQAQSVPRKKSRSRKKEVKPEGEGG